MRIVNIFDIITESLYSVQYDTESDHEFSRIFDAWTDAEYLESFFEEHQEDLKNGIWGRMTIEEAILITRKEAIRLEDELLEIAKTGKTNRYETLSTLFKPLHNATTQIEAFEFNKVKGDNRRSWLRIYAIRIDSNLFVISGGAIKLTRTMNERAHLLEELQKLEITKLFLTEGDDLDLPVFELFL